MTVTQSLAWLMVVSASFAGFFYGFRSLLEIRQAGLLIAYGMTFSVFTVCVRFFVSDHPGTSHDAFLEIVSLQGHGYGWIMVPLSYALTAAGFAAYIGNLLNRK